VRERMMDRREVGCKRGRELSTNKWFGENDKVVFVLENLRISVILLGFFHFLEACPPPVATLCHTVWTTDTPPVPTRVMHRRPLCTPPVARVCRDTPMRELRAILWGWLWLSIIMIRLRTTWCSALGSWTGIGRCGCCGMTRRR